MLAKVKSSCNLIRTKNVGFLILLLGFLGLAVLRGVGLLPHGALRPASDLASLLTILSMAALGLQTDLRAAVRAGGRVTATVVLSLLALGVVSLALIHCLRSG